MNAGPPLDDHVVLLTEFTDAMQTMPNPVPVYFSPEVLMAVIAHVQLALRHPGAADNIAAAAMARAFVDTAKLAFPPSLQQFIELGDAAGDIEVEIPVDWTTRGST